jgi:poly-gamma-glutamate system protein
MILFAIVSLGAFATLQSFSVDVQSGDRHAEEVASTRMERALGAVREEFVSRGYRFDDQLDPNHTALIGTEYSEMVTTLGGVEAKRSTTNPAMAGLIVRLMREAGVTSGDTVAVGCSGSFPALAIATLCAARALNVHPVMILSLGSSSYGANRIDWTLLDIVTALTKKGLVDVSPAAVSLGGADDAANDLEVETRLLLIDKIRTSGYRFINQSNLRQNVAERLRVYLGEDERGSLKAFVNIGGSFADLGTDPVVLKLEPGINRQIQLPEREEQYGVVFAMAKRHIPVIHLLHIKGLVLKYGLPWDPTPLPAVTVDGPSHRRSEPGVKHWAVGGFYFVVLAMIVIFHRKEFFRISSRSRL